jgi:flagellar hook protein FlgE
VQANARASNTVQGDIQSASIGTFVAINGDGYFVVEKPTATVDARPVFDGVDLYTRRGDFQTDKSGYLVNGAGYYLMGIPVDPTTGNLAGSVPQLLKFQNDFLPAQATTKIDYRANLASYPLTPSHDTSIPGSELINPAAFSANPLAGAPSPAKFTGTGAAIAPDAVAVATGSADISALSSAGGTIDVNGTTVTIAAGDNAAAIVTKINAAATGVTASINASNKLVLTSADADTGVTIGGGSTLALLTELGVSVGATQPTNLLTQSTVAGGQTFTLTVGTGSPQTITFGTGAGQVSTLNELSTALGGLTGVLAAVNTSTGNISITASSLSDTLSIGGTATPLVFGLHTTSALPSNQSVIGNDVTTFLNQSIGGGAVTAYDVSGSPVNMQLRWAKTDSSTTGGTDTWNLFYQTNSNATGTQVAWKNAGVDYTFGANGQMSPLIANTTLSGVTIDGVSLGDVTLAHGTGGLTEFADNNGNVQVNLLQQNGFAAGSLQSVSVNEKGRVVGSYSNGRTLDLAEITIANFNGANNLKRIDGGAFEVTDESGPALYGAAGKIVGSSLESSNVDIADEFSKLIVTQQAYSANTKVVSTANQMVQDLLNTLR